MYREGDSGVAPTNGWGATLDLFEARDWDVAPSTDGMPLARCVVQIPVGVAATGNLYARCDSQ